MRGMPTPARGRWGMVKCEGDVSGYKRGSGVGGHG